MSESEDAGVGIVTHLEYPVHLGIAYIFLVGYLVRTLFVTLRLPASVGVLLSGFAFSHFFQTDLYFASWSLQELAFFLVLMEAGLEITLRDLQPYIFVMASLPWTLEVLAVGAYGVATLGFTPKEALVLGTIVSPLGPGLVIPKMKEFGNHFRLHPLPRLVFTWAPLEGSLALISFGFLCGLADPAHQYSVDFSVLVLANTLRILATLAVGTALGVASGWLISRRLQLNLNGQPVFTGTPVESFLMILTVALVAYSLGAGQPRRELVPMGFAPGSWFQSELLVIVTSTTFAMVSDREELRDVQSIMGGVWVFGQLILFSIVGSRTRIDDILPKIVDVFPIIGVGVAFRLAGVLAALFLTRKARGCQMQSSWGTMKDAAFCFLATLPRATLQAALGAVPVTARFFQGAPHREEVATFIFTAARVYICCMSIVGHTLLHALGPVLLESTSERPEMEHCKGKECDGPTTGRGLSVASIETVSGRGSDVDVLGAIGQMAEEHGVDPKVLMRFLDEQAEEYADNEQQSELGDLSRSASEGKDYLPLSGIREPAVRRPAPTLRTIRTGDLVLSQFDTIGSLYSSQSSAWHPPRRKSRERADTVG
eukprot:CAMPEP_0179031362 /NCGR_PEP_ID=MMETSP0796-20121207/11031_1 /TAXON_ID=73915 /ORGANISM="Pyrodinium bahamense, Strain pbaha01" /LENGTH=597 /DNA_ID=CAMNT_0020727551 /DNA_START=128 /DNA_END=1921 /DNA_ORIENTATION=+